MCTNFPSKLSEFAQFGKPLILWGPAKATGPQWGRDTEQGLVVDEENPDQLRIALERLCGDEDEQKRLSCATGSAAKAEFDPELIQSQFRKYLSEIIS
jgi:glycosyltransferase involved in cell wall biosynthesis